MEMNVKPTGRSQRKGVGETTTARRQPVTRARVVEAALKVMDEEGLEAVTMRRIGRELGVEAMSLYNHVQDKDDILEGMTEMVMSEFEIPAPTDRWSDDLRAMSLEWRRLLRLHPAVCQLLAERHKPLEGLETYRAMDAALETLCRGGLTARDAAQAFNALGGYIMGFVMMEQGLMPGHDAHEHVKHHEAVAEAVEALGFPRLVECFRYFAECPTDEQFGFGLDLMVRGLEAMVAEG